MQIPISRPYLPDPEGYAREVTQLLRTGQITNGETVRRLEEAVSARLGGIGVVAVASATVGLMLALRALARPGEEVLIPSFTFPATLQAALWCGLKPRLVDVDPETYTVTVETLERAATPQTRFVVPVYVFGACPDWDRLGPFLEDRGIQVVSDAAHALGSAYGGRPAGGWGRAEVFSLAPTKLLVAGEGGLVATRDPELAERIRLSRNHGNAGNYQCDALSLNGRMSELHALLALRGLETLEDQIGRRQAIQRAYAEALADLPGVRFQRLPSGSTSTWNYVGIRFERQRFGAGPAEIQEALAREGIESRRYFHPPLHHQTGFHGLWEPPRGGFPGTEVLVEEILCVPAWSGLGQKEIGRVVDVIRRVHAEASGARKGGVG
jgi:dTDP-4-amino-4,6-dideoxygalactose transaminase